MAKYLIDANLPRHMRIWNDAGCAFVADIGATLHDIEIWNYAEANGLTIVSKDADFANLVLLREDGPSVIHMRLGNMKFRQLEEFLERAWTDICNVSENHRLIQVYANRIEAIS